jgi:hypothetical protein
MQMPSAGGADAGLLASCGFSLEGRRYVAELRYVGFPRNDADSDPRWVVFDDALGRHWTLEGPGSSSDAPDDILGRFQAHLARLAKPRGWRRLTLLRHPRQ